MQVRIDCPECGHYAGGMALYESEIEYTCGECWHSWREERD